MAYICEHCGKVVEDKDKFGSGRFCCRSCANSRTHSAETKNKIKMSVNKLTDCSCQYCGKKFSKLTSKATHECYCSLNPNKIENYSAQLNHSKRLHKKYKLCSGEELDVTTEYVLNYLKEHPTCEICGRTVAESVITKRKGSPKRLCVDHSHLNNHFRGVLCSLCNRQLGWYESYQNSIKKYLNKK